VPRLEPTNEGWIIIFPRQCCIDDGAALGVLGPAPEDNHYPQNDEHHDGDDDTDDRTDAHAVSLAAVG